MNKFTEEFYALSESYKRLKVECAVLDKKAACLDVSFIGVPEHIDALTETDKNKIKADVQGIIKTFFEVKVSFKKAYADSANITARIFDFLNTSYPSVMVNADPDDCLVDVDRASGIINVKMGFGEYMKSFAESVGLAEKICGFLDALFIESSSVEFFLSAKPQNEYKIKDTAPSFVKRDMINVSDVEKVYGKTVLSYPKPIKNIVDESDTAVLCGKIGRLDKRISKTSGNPYYIFELSDTTGRISAKLFPRKKSNYNNKFSEMSGEADIDTRSGEDKTQKSGTEAIDSLTDNEEIVASGSVRRDVFSKDLVFIVNDINRCKIDYASIQDSDDGIEYNEAGEEYITVSPSPYVSGEQQDFLAETAEAPTFLKGKTFVVFDCETTGLDRNNDKIIELAAVKIVDGNMTETFSTFVNPETKLPPEIIALTHITDDDLKTAPKISAIFHDFYKFTRGAALVAHNIEFDMDFVRRAAKQTGFRVNNDIYDTMTIARKNYNVHNYKLGTLCEFFKIDLTDAHRAVYDAIATAKLFIKMAVKL
ncbi:MAG: ribonuclease H-like domain-containing protein [Clostridiales bacterium]|jgi:DNA polymerase-3 subunit alpha (Gram-positive type)|nr:ribonuclease H-like domain-containing protein [Clostridiales bacterium]